MFGIVPSSNGTKIKVALPLGSWQSGEDKSKQGMTRHCNRPLPLPKESNFNNQDNVLP